MSTSTPSPEPTPTVVDLIEHVQREMSNTAPGSDEFGKMADQLTKLYAIGPKPRVNLDTLLPSLASLSGIMLILNHERLNVITTKALGFVTKARI